METTTSNIAKQEGAPIRADVVTPVTQQHLHTKIEGRVDVYRSSYWSGALAAFGIRYLARPFTGDKWTKPITNFKDFAWRYAYSTVAGGIMYALTFTYAWKNYKDVRNIFSETVAWELGKDAKDVNARDLWKSSNPIVHRTMQNFVKYNVRRLFFNTFFFLPWIPGIKKYFSDNKLIAQNPRLMSPETPVDIGIAGNSMYLLSDIFYRKETFFERLQTFIDTKINHVDRASDLIKADDLLNLYDLHARNNKLKLPVYAVNTPEWKNTREIFERMADLMNQTYNNSARTDDGNFTVPEFLYLLGNGYIRAERPQESLAYIELANRYDINAVKEVAAAVKTGQTLEYALQKYPLANAVANHSAMGNLAAPEPAVESQVKKYAGMKPPLSQVEKQAQRADTAVIHRM